MTCEGCLIGNGGTESGARAIQFGLNPYPACADVVRKFREENSSGMLSGGRRTRVARERKRKALLCKLKNSRKERNGKRGKDEVTWLHQFRGLGLRGSHVLKEKQQRIYYVVPYRRGEKLFLWGVFWGGWVAGGKKG